MKQIFKRSIALLFIALAMAPAIAVQNVWSCYPTPSGYNCEIVGTRG
jgi:hypothetical protein